MKSIKSISRVAAVAGAIAIAAQFAMVPAAFAKDGVSGKSPKCYATAVAGSPGTYVWTCTTGRP